MTDAWNWLADGVLVVLLSGTLVMAIRLDRGLRLVRRDRAAFEALISSLSAATGSVSSGIQALRNEAERAAEAIERRTLEADKMATDLSFLVEAADRAGAKLEQKLQALAAPPAAAPQNTTPLAAAPQTTALSGAAPTRRRAKTAPQTPAAPATPELETGTAPQPGPDMPAPADEASPAASLATLRELAGFTTHRRTSATALTLAG